MGRAWVLERKEFRARVVELEYLLQGIVEEELKLLGLEGELSPVSVQGKGEKVIIRGHGNGRSKVLAVRDRGSWYVPRGKKFIRASFSDVKRDLKVYVREWGMRRLQWGHG